jgi:hypothetical protein
VAFRTPVRKIPIALHVCAARRVRGCPEPERHSRVRHFRCFSVACAAEKAWATRTEAPFDTDSPNNSSTTRGPELSSHNGEAGSEGGSKPTAENRGRLWSYKRGVVITPRSRSVFRDPC